MLYTHTHTHTNTHKPKDIHIYQHTQIIVADQLLVFKTQEIMQYISVSNPCFIKVVMAVQKFLFHLWSFMFCHLKFVQATLNNQSGKREQNIIWIGKQEWWLWHPEWQVGAAKQGVKFFSRRDRRKCIKEASDNKS